MIRLSTLLSRFSMISILEENLRTTHDSSERTFDVIQYFINSFHFFLHQVTEHLVVFVEIFSDQSRRSVCTVSCTESVVYVAVSIRSQFLGEFLSGFLFTAFLAAAFSSSVASSAKPRVCLPLQHRNEDSQATAPHPVAEQQLFTAASSPIQSLANCTSTPNNSDRCFRICFKENLSAGPFGRPR